jgi:hypothetical protein
VVVIKVVELKDVNILVVIVVAAHVKCAVMVVNMLANAPVDASVLLALAIVGLNSAALNAVVVVVGARC